MDRRSFLKRSVLTAAGLSVPATAARAAESRGSVPAAEPKSAVAGRLPGSHLQLSCAAYSFRQQLGGDTPSMTLEDFVDLCAREELAATELTSYYFRDTSPAYLRSLRRRAYVNGLAISGTPVGNNFCKPPGQARENEIRKVRTWIDHVAILGSQTIRVFAGSVPRDGSPEEARAWAIDCFREVAEYAGERGVLLGLENHGGITATVDELLGLVRGVDSPWFGVNLDTGNFHDRPYESMEKAAPYAVSVQVKVRVTGAGEKKEEADFPRVMDILRRHGYRGYVALEYEEREDPIVAVPRYLKLLRDAIANA